MVASNLAANGYNFYGGYATRAQDFNFLANGVVLPNTQTLRPVLKADVAQARAELAKTMSGN